MNGSRGAQKQLQPGRVVLVGDRATGLPQLAALLSKPAPPSGCPSPPKPPTSFPAHLVTSFALCPHSSSFPCIIFCRTSPG